MKRNIFVFAIIATVCSCFFTGCNENADKWSDVMDGADVGSAIPFTKFQTPRIFDVANLDTYEMKYELNVGAVGEGLTYKRVIINKSFNGGEFVEHASIDAASIPADISVSAAEAIVGITIMDGDVERALTLEDIQGGDFFDWEYLIEFADGSNGNYADEAANSFPNFRSFFASSLDFEFAASYTLTVLETNVPDLVKPVMLNQTIATIPGAANSQFIVQDMTAGIVDAFFGVGDVNYRIYYIGNNEFALNAGSEGWPGLIKCVGDVTLDPSTGVLTCDIALTGSCCGMAASEVRFEMVPD